PMVVAPTVFIDGTTQTRFFGDTNPDGPEVEINGELSGAGDGLSLRTTCIALVDSVTISGFAGNGVFATTDTRAQCREGFRSAGIRNSVITKNTRGVFTDRLTG